MIKLFLRLPIVKQIVSVVVSMVLEHLLERAKEKLKDENLKVENLREKIQRGEI